MRCDVARNGWQPNARNTKRPSLAKCNSFCFLIRKKTKNFVRESLNAGADDFVYQPIKFREL